MFYLFIFYFLKCRLAFTALCFCPLKGKNWWMQLEDIPSPLLIVVAADSVPHIIPPSSLPSLFTTSPAVNCLRIQQQTWTIFIPLLCCFSLLSLAPPSRLPFCTCMLPSFHPFMSARQLPPPFLLSIDFLLSFCPSLPSSIPSRANIHPHLSFYTSLSLGFPSLHLSVVFCVACVHK